MRDDTHELETFIPIGLAAEWVVRSTTFHANENDNQPGHEKRPGKEDDKKDPGAELEIVQARLRLANLIKAALRSPWKDGK